MINYPMSANELKWVARAEGAICAFGSLIGGFVIMQLFWFIVDLLEGWVPLIVIGMEG